MPAKDYMNEAQLAFKEKLLEMQAEILSNADETTEHLRDNEVVPDPADRATIEERARAGCVRVTVNANC